MRTSQPGREACRPAHGIPGHLQGVRGRKRQTALLGLERLLQSVVIEAHPFLGAIVRIRRSAQRRDGHLGQLLLQSAQGTAVATTIQPPPRRRCPPRPASSSLAPDTAAAGQRQASAQGTAAAAAAEAPRSNLAAARLLGACASAVGALELRSRSRRHRGDGLGNVRGARPLVSRLAPAAAGGESLVAVEQVLPAVLRQPRRLRTPHVNPVENGVQSMGVRDRRWG